MWKRCLSYRDICVFARSRTCQKQPYAKYAQEEKTKNHKIIRNTQKKQKYFQEKEKNIVCSLHTSIAIMHNVTRSYEYEKDVEALLARRPQQITQHPRQPMQQHRLPRLPIRQQQQQKQQAVTMQTRKSAYAFTSSPITS